MAGRPRVALPAPAAPLVQTKLSAPPLRPNVVHRPRLLAQLEAGVRRPLTLVVAPAGFGKTTLLSAWQTASAENAMPVAWVSLDKGDNDPVRFWSYAIATLDDLLPGVGAAALRALRSPQGPQVEAVLTSLLNALATLTADTALVLDDYHHIKVPAVHQTMSFLLDHVPRQLHVIIATRSDPPLPLSRLRAANALSELRASDLRFTLEEVKAFLNDGMGLSLDMDAVAALEERTEGWIAGLQLAALSLKGRPAEQAAQFIEAFTGSNRFVMDYMVDEVLRLQSVRTRAFLLHTSVLDRMCAPLCDAVLSGSHLEDPRVAASDRVVPASPSAQEMLEQLERANLFVVPLDDERQWYRYHHLFADVLRNRLHQSRPDVAASLHRRASAWFEAQGLVQEAVAHALAAPDHALAARLIERYGTTAVGPAAVPHAAGLHAMDHRSERGSEYPALIPPLTDRETEVLRLIAAGASNREIAQTLVVSVGTVKKHGNNIFGKLGVESRTQAVARAQAMRLI